MHIPLDLLGSSAYIFARDAAIYLAFLRDELGGEVVSIVTGPDEKVRNAHVRFGDMT
jgi:hypothetical protein